VSFHGADAKDGQASIELAKLLAHRRKKLLRIALGVDKEACGRIVALRNWKIRIRLRRLIKKQILSCAGDAYDLNGRAVFLSAKRFPDGILPRPDFFREGIVDDCDFGRRGRVGFGKLTALDDGSAGGSEIAGLDFIVETGFGL